MTKKESGKSSGIKYQRVACTLFDMSVDLQKKDWSKYEDVAYCTGQLEACPKTDEKHWQFYIEFNKRVGLKRVKEVVGSNKVHVEIAKGSGEDNDKYCSKVETRYLFEGWKYGEHIVQGKRTDLIEIKKKIEAGTKVETLTMENPQLYHQYGRTLSKLEDIIMRKKFRTEMTKCIWYHGKTGVGKSHKAYENFSIDTHYVLPNDKGWWDAYQQQETVIINDFRGEITYNEILQLIDKWPYSVKRRGREPIPFISKKVIITSSLPPHKIYKNRADEDDIQQLLRRIEVIKMT